MILQWLAVSFVFWGLSTVLVCPLIEIGLGKSFAWLWFLITTLGLVISITSLIKQ